MTLFLSFLCLKPSLKTHCLLIKVLTPMHGHIRPLFDIVFVYSSSLFTHHNLLTLCALNINILNYFSSRKLQSKGAFVHAECCMEYPPFNSVHSIFRTQIKHCWSPQAGIGSLPTFTSIRVSIIIYCKIAYIFQFSH